jgi:hypothetical protein
LIDPETGRDGCLARQVDGLAGEQRVSGAEWQVPAGSANRMILGH